MAAILPLHEAVKQFIQDGDTVALEGFTHLIPTAAGHEIIRQGKRDLTLACLPRQYYTRIFEPACANGELSAALAERTEALLCQDLNATAVELARRRLAACPQASVSQGHLPGDWPGGEFDLIVLDVMLPCHWLHPIDGCPQDGRQVHALLDQRLPLYRAVRHEEADFLLEYWCCQPCAIDLQEPCL